MREEKGSPANVEFGKERGETILSKTHKIYVAPYLALRDTCQRSMLALLQERERLALNSRGPQQTSYL